MTFKKTSATYRRGLRRRASTTSHTIDHKKEKTTRTTRSQCSTFFQHTRIQR